MGRGASPPTRLAIQFGQCIPDSDRSARAKTAPFAKRFSSRFHVQFPDRRPRATDGVLDPSTYSRRCSCLWASQRATARLCPHLVGPTDFDKPSNGFGCRLVPWWSRCSRSFACGLPIGDSACRTGSLIQAPGLVFDRTWLHHRPDRQTVQKKVRWSFWTSRNRGRACARG